MNDATCVYINVCVHISVDAPLVSPPPGIINSSRPAGVKRDVQTDGDDIYGQNPRDTTANYITAKRYDVSVPQMQLVVQKAASSPSAIPSCAPP
ncbi:hypothetical protein MY10362_009189 [Beauveria mimosiformis]